MKKRNILIVVLILIGLIGIMATDFVIKPRLEENKAKYEAKQLSPLTNDIENAKKFKSKYMGNVINSANISGTLPLRNIDRTFENKPKHFEFILNYKVQAATINEKVLKTAMLYNSTAYFALIDNLEIVTFNFKDVKYSVKRSYVKKWYGIEFSKLLEEDTWKTQVQEKLLKYDYIDKFWGGIN